MYKNQPKPGFGFGRNQSPFDDDFFSLGAPVGPGQPNRREDVIKVETILGNTGDYDIGRFQGPVGHFGELQEKAVKSWQERNKYKVDGTLLQNGPTITGLKKQTGGLLGGLKPPTPDEVDDHHDRLGRGEPGILNTRPARLSIRVPQQVPELDEQTLAFNADSARALTRTSVDGDVPKIYANYLKQAGSEGHTTLLDLVEQVNNAQGRDRAERVLHGILGQLPPDQAKAFLGGEVPAQRPIGVRIADLARDDNQPLFTRAAVGPKMDAMATAKGPIPGSGDVLTVPIDFPVHQVQQSSEEQKPVQVAAGPAAIPLLPLLMGGAAVTGGAIAQQQIQQQMNKPQGQQTTVADPLAGKPQVLPGADLTQQPVETGTPPSKKPESVPPPPPSKPQSPLVQGNSYPGRPAEPEETMGPVETRTLPPHKQLDHLKGAPSHPSTKEGLDKAISDPELRSRVEKEKILTGKTAAYGHDGVVIDAGNGGAEAGLEEFEEDARRLGAKIEDIPGMPGGKKYVDPKTGQSGSFRPKSVKEGRVTVETTFKGANGEKFTVKRRH